MAPHPRAGVLHGCSVEGAVLDVAVHAVVAECLVVLVEAVVEAVDVLVVDDAVRVVVPALRGGQVINGVVRIIFPLMGCVRKK